LSWAEVSSNQCQIVQYWAFGQSIEESDFLSIAGSDEVLTGEEAEAAAVGEAIFDHITG
jgi:hypothetical protein